MTLDQFKTAIGALKESSIKIRIKTHLLQNYKLIYIHFKRKFH